MSETLAAAQTPGLAETAALRARIVELEAALAAQRAAHDAEESLYRQMFLEHTAVKLLIDPASGAIVEANPAAAQFYGYPLDQLRQMNIAQINMLPPEEVARRRQAAAARETNVFVFPHRLASGEAREVEVRSTPLHRGGRTLLFSIIHDVTERARTESALRASEQKHRRLFEAMTQGVVYYDAAGRLTAANPAAAGLLHLAETQLLDQTFVDTGWLLLQEDGTPLPPAEHPVALALRTGQPAGRRILGLFHAALGVHLWLSVTAFPLYFPGTPTLQAVYSIFEDLTERKEAEQHLQTLLAEKEVLLKEVHHRVKNNLQVMIGLLGLQADRIADPAAQAVFQDSQERIRAIALVHEQLYQSSDLAQIDFTAYLSQLVQNLQVTFPPSAAVAVELAAGPLWLGVDTAIPCGLIVNELVANALKYAFPAGRPGRVRVGFALEAEGAPRRFCLTVADDGVGLPAGLDPAQTRSLGLQLVHILARQLRGDLQITAGAGVQYALSFVELKEWRA